MRLFVFGIGYSARSCIELLKKRCDWIGGTTRSIEKATELKKNGIKAFIFDGNARTSEIRNAIKESTHLLVSIAPSKSGDCVIQNFSNEITNSAIEWIGYLSTVGVYGNHNGDWVDENTECRPVSNRSIWRVEAESEWNKLANQNNLPISILRLAGIYGPGRNAFVNLTNGTAKRIVKPGQVFNRIHVEDIAGAVTYSIDQTFNGILNVSDGNPCPPQEVVTFAAKLLGVDPPAVEPFENAKISTMARSFYSENKRVSNQKLRTLLNYKLKFPNYQVALKHLIKSNWHQQ